MSSNTIYTFCTYLTVYSGNKLPPFYIGSSTIKKVESGYRGSVKSKKYRKIFELELIESPQNFKSFIITRHKSRKDALAKESFFQKQLKVVNSSLYMNMAVATKNGYFGRDVSGKNNPFFGKKHSKETLLKIKNTRDTNPQIKTEANRRCSETKIKLYSKLAKYTDPFGNEYTHRGIITFCEMHDLSYACMRKVLEKKNKTHKGWTAYYIE